MHVYHLWTNLIKKSQEKLSMASQFPFNDVRVHFCSDYGPSISERHCPRLANSEFMSAASFGCWIVFGCTQGAIAVRRIAKVSWTLVLHLVVFRFKHPRSTVHLARRGRAGLRFVLDRSMSWHWMASARRFYSWVPCIKYIACCGPNAMQGWPRLITPDPTCDYHTPRQIMTGAIIWQIGWRSYSMAEN